MLMIYVYLTLEYAIKFGDTTYKEIEHRNERNKTIRW